MGKNFHELLQILVNWDENLGINIDKDLSFLLRMLLVRIWAWIKTSDTLDDESEIDLVLLAGPISHTSTRCMDFVEIFNIILDLSITCFSRFSGC